MHIYIIYIYILYICVLYNVYSTYVYKCIDIQYDVKYIFFWSVIDKRL